MMDFRFPMGECRLPGDRASIVFGSPGNGGRETGWNTIFRRSPQAARTAEFFLQSVIRNRQSKTERSGSILLAQDT